MRILMIIAAAAVVTACQSPASEASPAQAPSIQTCFEPDDDCIALAVREIDGARQEILVHAYAFTNKRIVNALGQAEGRGVQVRMIVDDSREGSARIGAVAEAGGDILTDDQVSLQHNKIMIFDRHRVLTGSQNFTKASESHAENMLVIEDQPTVDAYVANWERRAAASRPYRSIPMTAAEAED